MTLCTSCANVCRLPYEQYCRHVSSLYQFDHQYTTRSRYSECHTTLVTAINNTSHTVMYWCRVLIGLLHARAQHTIVLAYNYCTSTFCCCIASARNSWRVQTTYVSACSFFIRLSCAQDYYNRSQASLHNGHRLTLLRNECWLCGLDHLSNRRSTASTEGVDQM